MRGISPSIKNHPFYYFLAAISLTLAYLVIFTAKEYMTVHFDAYPNQ
ncbi:hypothetical protein HMPREF0454_00718 [Hafnia alvei ATCC 51873]|uniref:Uncharacterized protein n=1 Tax=Hafnia alvei ATCC 51873 TaxID=1002364 RepID=G9Y2A6_HAFAL|nr:hypothetical protein HMPREF0454_00718 [Hafnia alvei ATCC 51873]